MADFISRQCEQSSVIEKFAARCAATEMVVLLRLFHDLSTTSNHGWQARCEMFSTSKGQADITWYLLGPPQE